MTVDLKLTIWWLELKLNEFWAVYWAELNGHRFQMPAWLGGWLIDFAEEHERYGTKVFGKWLWAKLPLKINRAWCALIKHEWYCEDTGDEELGPGEVVVYCLRCDAHQVCEYNDVYAVTPIWIDGVGDME